MKTNRTGAKGALLDEYERAILELQKVISTISDRELTQIVDPETSDENCRSIQSILAHVVQSGYSYARYVQNKPKEKVRLMNLEPTAGSYINALKNMFDHTENVFQSIEEKDLIQNEMSQKFRVSWGPLYDIEQIMEHAIVHILRHRRQIEKFKGILNQ